ncbi:MAG: PEP-CTERM sorting domain-containing protein [Verrucomicrobiota bacterium]|nr:PEP-CTERM sorting domain-containing protein [Verrucomicrobiota bacterium]
MKRQVKQIGAALVGVLLCTSAGAAITNFGDFTLNGNGNSMTAGLPIISGGGSTLQLTSGAVGSAAASAWHNSKVFVNQDFALSFVFQQTQDDWCDGFAMVFQNSGLTAVGGDGGSVGYGGIGQSAAIRFNLTPGSWGSDSNALHVVKDGSMSPLSFEKNTSFRMNVEPIGVSFNYNSVSGTMSYTVNNGVDAAFSGSQAMNLASMVGDTTAWFGFTAATGGKTSNLTYSNLSSTISVVPEPSTYAAFACLGTLLLVLLRRRK